MGNAVMVTQEVPICLPQTNEAKFLRSLGISPSAGPERLKYATGEYIHQFRRPTEWWQMSGLLRWAWGESSPVAKSGGNGKKPRLIRRPTHR